MTVFLIATGLQHSRWWI